jgi:hypothetical protein
MTRAERIAAAKVELALDMAPMLGAALAQRELERWPTKRCPICHAVCEVDDIGDGAVLVRSACGWSAREIPEVRT